MTNTENLFELVYILLEKKHSTAANLAQHFGVSARTIYRWIDSLCVAGIPIYMTKGNGGGIWIEESYALDKTVLTKEERMMILASLNAIKSLTGEKNGANSNALQKLKGLSKANTDWLEVDFATWNPQGEYLRKLFEDLKNAIISQKMVQFEYFSSYGKNTRRTVQPWKLIFRGQAWYLHGWCQTKNEPRFFKLSRMKNLRFTGQPVNIQLSSINTQDYEKPFDDPREVNLKKIQIKIQADSQAVYRIMDEFYIEKEERKNDGSSILTFYAPDTYWLFSWLLSFGSLIKVLEPEEIVGKIENEAKRMLQK